MNRNEIIAEIIREYGETPTATTDRNMLLQEWLYAIYSDRVTEENIYLLDVMNINDTSTLNDNEIIL